MAQQPNIELRASDLPPEDLKPPPSRWSPSRPGEISGPQEQPWGGAFGTPGPDTGWVQRLIQTRSIESPPGENPELLRALIAAVAGSRASILGRAPVPEDIDYALLALGLAPDQLSGSVVERLSESRRHWVREAAHERIKGRALVAALGPEVLSLKPGELRHRLIVESHEPSRRR